MVAERALPATMAIHSALENELNVFNRIGATFGNAYCGVVGGVKRHEYAVMGPSVQSCSAFNVFPDKSLVFW
jgi:class 3 adenylate cyclase